MMAELDGAAMVSCSVRLVGGFAHFRMSRNPRRRIDNLRTGAATPVALVGKIPGDVEVERSMHERFARYREHGEWFRDVRVIRRAFEGGA